MAKWSGSALGEGLKRTCSQQLSYYGSKNKSWRKDAAQYDWDSQEATYANKPQLSVTNGSGYSFTNQAFIEYANLFGKHALSVLAGFEQYYEWGDSYWGKRTKPYI